MIFHYIMKPLKLNKLTQYIGMKSLILRQSIIILILIFAF
jgi:hypothetical protein